jgi:DNA-directed RNA polymerase subunit RPC12/RpoP
MSTPSTERNLEASDVLHCPLCGGTIFHRSRFKMEDLIKLFLFQLPLRCHDCGERNYVNVPAALKAHADSRRHAPMQ